MFYDYFQVQLLNYLFPFCKLFILEIIPNGVEEPGIKNVLCIFKVLIYIYYLTYTCISIVSKPNNCR